VNWSAILAVLGKELRETLRDRRTLIVMIVVPVLLYPAMLIVMEQIALFGRRSLEATAVRVALIGPVPDDGRYLDADPNITATRPDTVPLNDLRDGTLDAVLVFAGTEWSVAGSNRFELLYDGARDRSTYARGIVQRRLDTWGDSIAQVRLRELGLPPDLAAPVAIDARSIATPRAVGGYMLGRFLPLLLILMTILGAFYPSIDLAAGEKERGTLEALLTVPVNADNLVIGKFVAAALMGLTAATLNLGSMLLTFQAGVVRFGGAVNIQFHLPASAVLLIFAVLALLAILFSSLFLGIAVRSHSFKEAQNALTPVYILSLIPAMLPMMPGISFSSGFALIPVAGVGFLFRDLMGGSVAAGPAVIAVAATTFYAGLALAFAARAFGREEVLFGTGAATRTVAGGAGWLGRFRVAPAGVPGPGAALGLVAVVALLFFYGARPLVLSLGERGILLSQWLFLALPALLFVAVARYSPRETFALRRPAPAALAASVLIILGGMPIGWLIAWLQSFVLDMPWELLEAMQELITADSPGRVLWLLLVVAATPAVCEELVFRGLLLRGFAARLPAWGSITATALVFGAFHLSFETAIRFLPTAWLGILLGFVVWRTRSIFPAMLMHLLNNGLIVLLVASPAIRERLTAHGVQPPWILVALAPIVLYAGFRLLTSAEPRSTTPTQLP
jgi:sodium transport system permease protein